jgi:hypothetical protein
MYSRLLQPKTAVFYASPEGETDDPFYGPIPRGVGGAPLDGIPDSPLNNKTPEYAEESRGYKNPLAEKGTETTEDANLSEGIPPGLIVAGKLSYKKSRKASVDIDNTDEEVYSVFRNRHSDRRIKNPWHCLAVTGLNGTLKQIFQSEEYGDVLLFPREGGKVLRIRGLNLSGGDNHIEDTGDSVSLKDGIRLEIGNHDRGSDERDNQGFQTGGLFTNFVKPISMSRKASVDIHESPTMLPPRDDLRRHIDEDALDEEEKPEMRHLISCLVVAEKEI